MTVLILHLCSVVVLGLINARKAAKKQKFLAKRLILDFLKYLNPNNYIKMFKNPFKQIHIDCLLYSLFVMIFIYSFNN